MKKVILLIIVIHFQIIAYNQVITGTVIDKKTNEKVCFANIYFNGTFVGTSSDENGNFRLDVSKNASMPLTISSIGYYSATLTDFLTDEPLKIYLEPKAFEMGEVVVSDKSLVRKRKANLRLFRSNFLGTTNNAMNCEILNEKDITFNYGSDRDTLRAFVYKGNIIFSEDLTTENANRELYKTRRKETYLGSRMHFFRSLWTNKLESDRFEIKDFYDKNIDYKNLVYQTTDNFKDSSITKKFFGYPVDLNIEYGKNSSTIVFLKPIIYFDEAGYCDPSIRWEGEMAEKRIGDTLPYEYEPE